jgi:hypothetical protein
VAAFVAAVLVLSLAGFSWLSVVIALVLAAIGVLAIAQRSQGVRHLVNGGSEAQVRRDDHEVSDTL